MELRSIFQSVIALHQEELPLSLKNRKQLLPINKDSIVTVTGIRRCGKSSLLALTINRLLQNGVRPEQILYIGFDDERLPQCRHPTSTRYYKPIARCIPPNR